MSGKFLLPLAIAAVVALPFVARAENAPGVTDSEIKIGQPMAYSGPAAPYGAMAKAELAYFQMVNDQGGVNGRKIVMISLDDGFNPAKTVEITRKLVEQDNVAFIFGPLGTMANIAIRKYMNDAKVPQIYPQDVANIYRDPKFPWTVGAPNITYFRDAFLCAEYIVRHKPNGKIGILYSDDPIGKEVFAGFKKGLGSRTDMIIKVATYEATDATIDSQIIQLQASGADVFMNATGGRFAPMAIRKAYDIGWRPMQFIGYVAASISATLAPAGLERSVGILSHGTFKEPSDPQWQNDSDVRTYLAWMNKYDPQPDPKNLFIEFGYYNAKLVIQLLKQCGNDLSRDNIVKQAANLKDPGGLPLLPNLVFNGTDPNEAQMRVIRFDGKKWELLPD
jgi:branched-chain amino acid transport system substrate-binding protein